MKLLCDHQCPSWLKVSFQRQIESLRGASKVFSLWVLNQSRDSITLNGVTSTLNWTFGHGSASNWYELTMNYQMDGNHNQDSYNVYLDNLTFSYQ